MHRFRDPGVAGEDQPLATSLIIGLRYHVRGVLHEYLGPAHLPGTNEIAHVFLRNEWRPHTQQQLPLTLVGQRCVDQSVEKLG